MAVALALRLHQLGALSLWLDEAYSAWFSSRTWRYLWTEVPLFETHPSFYYSLLKLWRVIGDDEFSLRLMSAVINVATIPLVALTARLCGDDRSGRRAAVLAAVLFACSATQMHAAQEARPYALLTFAMALALASSVAVMTAGPRAHVPLHRLWRQDRALVAAFAGIGAGIALLAWSHNFGPVLGLTLGACLVLFWIASGAPRGLFLNLTGSVVVAAALYAPNIPIVLMQTRSLGASGFWPDRPGAEALARALIEMPLGHDRPGDPVMLAAGIVALLAAVAGLAALRRAPKPTPGPVILMLGIMVVLPMALSFAISRVGQPIFLFRTLQTAQIPLLIGLAFSPLAIARLLPARLAWAAPVLPVGLALVALHGYETGRYRWLGEDWRQLTHIIAAKPDARIVVYPPESELPLRYYAAQSGLALDMEVVPAPYPARSPDYSYPAGGGGSPGIAPAMLPPLLDSLADETRIWIVTRYLEVYDPEGRLFAALGEAFPCLLDASLPRIELRARALPDGTCPAPRA